MTVSTCTWVPKAEDLSFPGGEKVHKDGWIFGRGLGGPLSLMPSVKRCEYTYFYG